MLGVRNNNTYDLGNKKTDLVTTNLSVDEVAAKMNWFVFRCVYIDGESPLMALPKYTSNVNKTQLNSLHSGFLKK